MEDRMESLRSYIRENYFRLKAYKVTEEDEDGLVFAGPYVIDIKPAAVSFYPVLRANPYDCVYWEDKTCSISVHLRYDTFHYLPEDLVIERLKEGIVFGRVNPDGYYKDNGEFVGMPMPEWEFVYRLYHHIKKRKKTGLGRKDHEILSLFRKNLPFDSCLLYECSALEFSLSGDSRYLTVLVLGGKTEEFIDRAFSLLSSLGS